MVRTRPRRSAFTIIEMFAVVVLIGMLIGLLLPAVQSSREMARRTSCANNLTQVGLAVHAYHTSFAQLPTPLSGTDGSTVAGMDNDRRLSAFVALTPFLQNEALRRKISNPLRKGWKNSFATGYYSMDEYEETEEASEESLGEWPAGGPEPFTADYEPWNFEIASLRCPSDPGIGSPAFGRTNYAFCFGDGVVTGDSGPFKEINGVFVEDPKLREASEAAMRGMFVPRVVMRFDDVTDGLSHTLMMAEIATDLGDLSKRTCPAVATSANALRDNPIWAREAGYVDIDRPEFWGTMPAGVVSADVSMRRGYRWADGMPLYTGFNTILPPNREITLSADRDDTWGILPPSSRHQSGIHVCFGDGRIEFIGDTIDAGDSSQPTVYPGSVNPPESASPYGLWGALGTRNTKELSAISHQRE